MSEILRSGRANPPPAWGLAARWSGWIGAAYAGVLLATRAAVTYRFGGAVFTGAFLTLLAVAELTALAIWPLLAAYARTPVRAAFVRATLQWAAILLLGAYLLVCLGALVDDTGLRLLARLLAHDLPAGVR
jgi:hypothetical protein